MAPAACCWASVSSSATLLPVLEFHTRSSRCHAVPVAVSAENSKDCVVEKLSDSQSSVSRREAVLAGLSALTGVGGVALLFPPAIGATISKQTELPIEDVKKIIEADIIERQYPVTGNLTESIYDENCRFQDPTLDMSGLKKYIAALQLLFDPASSRHEILNIEVIGPHSVEVNWRLRGYLKLPWHPYIPPYEGITTYTTNDNGLIISHSETWSISALTAFLQFLTPSWLSKDTPK